VDGGQIEKLETNSAENMLAVMGKAGELVIISSTISDKKGTWGDEAAQNAQLLPSPTGRALVVLEERRIYLPETIFVVGRSDRGSWAAALFRRERARALRSRARRANLRDRNSSGRPNSVFDTTNRRPDTLWQAPNAVTSALFQRDRLIILAAGALFVHSDDGSTSGPISLPDPNAEWHMSRGLSSDWIELRRSAGEQPPIIFDVSGAKPRAIAKKHVISGPPPRCDLREGFLQIEEEGAPAKATVRRSPKVCRDQRARALRDAPACARARVKDRSPSFFCPDSTNDSTVLARVIGAGSQGMSSIRNAPADDKGVVP
jgi:hypothetical protein